ncbi:hypothetical protein GCM10025784_07500 [Citricoccus nitrophenolicus]
MPTMTQGRNGLAAGGRRVVTPRMEGALEGGAGGDAARHGPPPILATGGHTERRGHLGGRSR